MASSILGTDPLVDVGADSPGDVDDTFIHDDKHQDLSGLDPPVPAKRKGGRKPIYATSEERKQRNRQAQAAFRERRTEYIKQMEITMKENEEVLENLRQDHREVADECTMLRYKTTLLEEMLDERGIDFRSELQARSNRSMLGQPRSQLQSPVPHMDQASAQPGKRRSANGTGARQERSIKGLSTMPGMSGMLPASRHALDPSQTSAPSPSSFTFPNLSPDVQSFDPTQNGHDRGQRQNGEETYENAAHRPHLSSGLARAQQTMMSHNLYDQQPGYGPDDSYDYTQEPLRQSQSRPSSNRLVREPLSKPHISLMSAPEQRQSQIFDQDISYSYQQSDQTAGSPEIYQLQRSGQHGIHGASISGFADMDTQQWRLPYTSIR